MRLVERIGELHRRLAEAGLPHAFGGALALAWCTRQARGTIDIDVNVFVGIDQLDGVLAAIVPPVMCTEAQRAELTRDGQSRLWWDDTPVDLFLNTTAFHEATAERIRWEPFAGATVPFLGCSDLAVFKAFFDRTKDWADLEAMAEAGTLDADRVVGVLARYLGPDDPRIRRLLAITAPD